MSEPFIAEIKIFAGNFNPRGWAFCDGQLLPIAQNTALFSLVGTIYGGDGRTTFGLPNLIGRAAMHTGNGPGLTPRQQGQLLGTTNETLNVSTIPSHTHLMQGSTDPATTSDATGAVPAASNGLYHSGPPSTVDMADATGNTGGNQSHDNMQPYLTLNFIIALQGLYPSRS